MSSQVGVLCFHKIGTPPKSLHSDYSYISAQQFEIFLDQIRESSWTVIDLETMLFGLASTQALPDRALLITFDDAYRSMHTSAMPLLRQFAFPSVVFVPASFVGSTNEFDSGLAPEEPLCCWDELLELQQEGVALQSHSLSHRLFSTLDNDEIQEELKRSKEAIESRTGRLVTAFAYPYGDPGMDTTATSEFAARAGYRAAFLCSGFSNRVPVRQRYSIARLLMKPDTDLVSFLTPQ